MMVETVTLSMEQLADLVEEVIRKRKAKPVISRTDELAVLFLKNNNQPMTLRQVANKSNRRIQSIFHAVTNRDKGYFEFAGMVPGDPGSRREMVNSYRLTTAGIQIAKRRLEATR